MLQFGIPAWFRCTLLGLAGVMGLQAVDAQAQNYPTRPIALIYPYSAGGGADIILRMMLPKATKALGQPIVMDYRPGGAGRLGAFAVMNARGGGHLLSMVANTTVISDPVIDPTFNFQPGKDYTPILVMFLVPYVLTVNATLPFRDVPGLVAYAKANPGKLNFGAGNLGAMSHIGMLMMNDKSGTDFTAIPYKGGSAMIFSALLSGEVQAALASSDIKPHVDSGRLVALAVTSAKRMSMYPNVPTANEAGLPYLSNLGTWSGIIAPADLPKDVPVKLNRAFDDALKTPEAVKKLGDSGFVMLGGSPEDFTTMIRREQEAVGPVIKKIKME